MRVLCNTWATSGGTVKAFRELRENGQRAKTRTRCVDASRVQVRTVAMKRRMHGFWKYQTTISRCGVGIKLHQVSEKTSARQPAKRTASLRGHFDGDSCDVRRKLCKYFTDSEIRDGKATKFNANVMLRGDAKTRYEAYHATEGFKTPNEIRALEERCANGRRRLFLNGNIHYRNGRRGVQEEIEEWRVKSLEFKAKADKRRTVVRRYS